MEKIVTELEELLLYDIVESVDNIIKYLKRKKATYSGKYSNLRIVLNEQYGDTKISLRGDREMTEIELEAKIAAEKTMSDRIMEQEREIYERLKIKFGEK